MHSLRRRLSASATMRRRPPLRDEEAGCAQGRAEDCDGSVTYDERAASRRLRAATRQRLRIARQKRFPLGQTLHEPLSTIPIINAVHGFHQKREKKDLFLLPLSSFRSVLINSDHAEHDKECTL